MTRYTVIWDDAVDTDFLDMWIKSDPTARAPLTEVANTIDQALSVDAAVQGASQPDGVTRALIIEFRTAAVTVYYEVDEAERRVLIRRLVFRHRMGPG